MHQNVITQSHVKLTKKTEQSIWLVGLCPYKFGATLADSPPLRGCNLGAFLAVFPPIWGDMWLFSSLEGAILVGFPSFWGAFWGAIWLFFPHIWDKIQKSFPSFWGAGGIFGQANFPVILSGILGLQQNSGPPNFPKLGPNWPPQTPPICPKPPKI